MEGHRFDEWARTLATVGSRRWALKALAAGLAVAIAGAPRARRGAAQQNVPIGGRCSAFGANAECSQVDTPAGGVPAICSDNGIAGDGAYNCCRNSGGVCGADSQCCGTAACVNGRCSGTRLPTPAPSGGALALGAECASTSQCSQTGGSVVCADNGIPSDGAKNCCRNSGGACAADLQCCAGLRCVNGTCGGATSPPPSGSGSLRPGATCTETAQCSQTGGAVICADNGIATDGPLNCCRTAGGACADSVYSADCCYGLYCRNGVCGNLPTDGTVALGGACTDLRECSQTGGETFCDDNGIATDGARNCCRRAGGACSGDAGCCAGLLCVNGTCGGSGTTGSGTSGGSLALGAACTSTEQCSQAGGAVTCADNGLPGDGALNCCRYGGGACAGDAGCCAGLLCVNGVCGGTSSGSGTTGSGTIAGGLLGLGAACTSDDQCSQEGGEVACRDNGLPGDGERNCCRYIGACFGDAGCCAGLVCVDGACVRV